VDLKARLLAIWTSRQLEMLHFCYMMIAWQADERSPTIPFQERHENSQK
jgi:hypothetical protein